MELIKHDRLIKAFLNEDTVKYVLSKYMILDHPSELLENILSHELDLSDQLTNFAVSDWAGVDPATFSDKVKPAFNSALNSFCAEYSIKPAIQLYFRTDNRNTTNTKSKRYTETGAHLACSKDSYENNSISNKIKPLNELETMFFKAIEKIKRDYDKYYSATQFNQKTIQENLLSYIWNYPNPDGHRASWAVKESAALLGNIESAQNKPGLGVAIYSIELALKAFGNGAKARIDNCIKWAYSQTFDEEPKLMKARIIYDIESHVEIVPDFRHTLALAIILARTQKRPARLEKYVKLMFDPKYKEGDDQRQSFLPPATIKSSG